MNIPFDIFQEYHEIFTSKIGEYHWMLVVSSFSRDPKKFHRCPEAKLRSHATISQSRDLQSDGSEPRLLRTGTEPRGLDGMPGDLVRQWDECFGNDWEMMKMIRK